MIFPSSILVTVSIVNPPLVSSEVSSWVTYQSGYGDATYFWLLAATLFGFSLLGIMIESIESRGRLTLTHSLLTSVDERVCSLSMAFFWRQRDTIT